MSTKSWMALKGALGHMTDGATWRSIDQRSLLFLERQRLGGLSLLVALSLMLLIAAWAQYFRGMSRQGLPAPVEFFDVEVTTVANEVSGILKSLDAPLKGFQFPLASSRYPKRALVLFATTASLPNVYSLVFSLRTVGKWHEDILVFSEDAGLEARDALRCLGVRWQVYSAIDAQYRFPSLMRHPPFMRAIPLLQPITREYDLLQFLSVDAVVIAPLRKVEMEDFDENVVLLLSESPERRSFLDAHINIEMIDSSRFLERFPGADDLINGPNHSKIGTATAYAVMLQRLELPPVLSRKLFDLNSNTLEALAPVEDESSILMLTFWGRWRTADFNGAFDIEPERLFAAPLTNGPSFVLTSKGKPEDLYVDERLFSLLLAASYLQCYGLVSHIDARKLPARLSERSMRRAVSQSAAIVRTAIGSTGSVWTDFVKKPSGTVRKERVLVHWATNKYVDDAYSVVFQARTIGRWDEDIVLICDELSPQQRRALECLNVDIQLYAPVEFNRAFPWAVKNVWYYKLLPFILPTLRRYEIIQYLDLDAIVSAPIVKRTKADFADDVVLLMEDNGYGQSFVKREFFDIKLSPAQMKVFLKRFPGADEPRNGPNLSPSAGACFHASLVSRLAPPEATLELFRGLARDYWREFEFGDQPLLMLAYWGRWRMRWGRGRWRPPVHHVFHAKMIHEETGGRIRYIHTGGAFRPPLPTSPYHFIDTFTRLLAGELLSCPAISKGLVDL